MSTGKQFCQIRTVMHLYFHCVGHQSCSHLGRQLQEVCCARMISTYLEWMITLYAVHNVNLPFVPGVPSNSVMSVNSVNQELTRTSVPTNMT